MDGTVLGALIGVGFLTVINVGVIAYSYGRLTQQVKDLNERLKRVEKVLNTKGGT